MVNVTFDQYYRYDDITRILNEFATEFPNLISIQRIGKSYEGRDVWLATITNTATGIAEEKPAMWVDGNIHATEVSAASACLYLIHKLTTSYGQDETITHILDTRAFYVCPRVNPDGAEWALADKPKYIRSSTRPHPFDEEPMDGFIKEDVDGDGRILFMRIKDPHGGWKISVDEPRFMIRREPEDFGGEYYRVIPEGTVEHYNGTTFDSQVFKEGLDLNRNFPTENWRPDAKQSGAGPYPTSEPEVHNIVDFITRHKNITGGIAFHTWSGVWLRAFGTQPDDEMPFEDLLTYKKMGDKAKELTGYTAHSVYHDFRYHPKETITGVFDDWGYSMQGIFSWVCEIWSPQKQAGIENLKLFDWYRDHPLEDDLKMLKWSDEKLAGKGYIDWYTFDHPQLGQVELGAWDTLYSWRNPPPPYLEAEIAPLAEFAIWQCMVSPKLEIVHAEATPIGGDNFHIAVTVQNTGWLPSYVSKQALERKLVRGVIAEIEVPEGAELKSGKMRIELKQLEGRAYQASTVTPWMFGGSTPDRARAEWIVFAPNGGTVKLTARHDRAGTARLNLSL